MWTPEGHGRVHGYVGDTRTTEHAKLENRIWLMQGSVIIRMGDLTKIYYSRTSFSYQSDLADEGRCGRATRVSNTFLVLELSDARVYEP